MNQNRLPADPWSLVLGITAILIIIGGCCCYGLPAVVALILGIVGLVISNRSLEEYQANPEIYPPNSRSNVYIGKILSIIAVVISSIVTLFVLLILVLYGSLFLGMAKILNDLDIKNQDWEQEEYENEYYYDESEDSLFIEEESDSLYYYEDSIQVDELKEVN